MSDYQEKRGEWPAGDAVSVDGAQAENEARSALGALPESPESPYPWLGLDPFDPTAQVTGSLDNRMQGTEIKPVVPEAGDGGQA